MIASAATSGLNIGGTGFTAASPYVSGSRGDATFRQFGNQA
jgi:hypothetical protein